MKIISNGKTYSDNYIDIKNKIVTFESADELNPTAPVTVPKVASGQSIKDIMRSFSMTVKNVRYLLKMLGTTDLSGIGDGTVTGAINSLNTGLLIKQYTIESYPNEYTDNVPLCYKSGHVVSILADMYIKKTVPGWTETKIGHLQGYNLFVTGAIFPIFSYNKGAAPLFIRIENGNVFLCSRAATDIADWFSGNIALLDW